MSPQGLWSWMCGGLDQWPGRKPEKVAAEAFLSSHADDKMELTDDLAKLLRWWKESGRAEEKKT